MTDTLTEQRPEQDRNYTQKRRWIASPLASMVLAGGLASIALAVSFNNSLGAVVAQITNQGNKAGALKVSVMEEHAGATAGGLKCSSTDTGTEDTLDGTNSVTCSWNKYSADGSATSNVSMEPGDTTTGEVSIKNSGSSSKTLTIDFGTCTTEPDPLVAPFTGNPCDHFLIKVEHKPFSGSYSSLGERTPTAWASVANSTVTINANEYSAFRFTLTFPAEVSAGDGTPYMGNAFLQDIIWQFS